MTCLRFLIATVKNIQEILKFVVKMSKKSIHKIKIVSVTIHQMNSMNTKILMLNSVHVQLMMILMIEDVIAKSQNMQKIVRVVILKIMKISECLIVIAKMKQIKEKFSAVII